MLSLECTHLNQQSTKLAFRTKVIKESNGTTNLNRKSFILQLYEQKKTLVPCLETEAIKIQKAYSERGEDGKAREGDTCIDYEDIARHILRGLMDQISHKRGEGRI